MRFFCKTAYICKDLSNPPCYLFLKPDISFLTAELYLSSEGIKIPCNSEEAFKISLACLVFYKEYVISKLSLFPFKFFLDLINYLKGRVTQREDIFHLLVHFPNTNNSQGCTTPRLRAKNSVRSP